MKIGPCIVCYEECGNGGGERSICCNQNVCEECQIKMDDLCPICEREDINSLSFCDLCDNSHKRLEVRECQSCMNRCCNNCSFSTRCCSTRYGKVYCDKSHVMCYECKDEYDKSDYNDIYAFIDAKQKE